ncbi:NUDIX domain-containing protein [Singulisphaera rosea]
MPAPYCYDYPRPAATVDLAVFALVDDQLRVLLIQRKHDPFAGLWAFPGGFLEIDEPIEDGARRELREETGFDASGPITFLGVFGTPGRDPRGRTISFVFGAAVRGPLPSVLGGDDASHASWIDPKEVPPLAFDHDEILAKALEWVSKAVEEGPIGLALLPLEFGDEDVKRLFRSLGKPTRLAYIWRDRRLKAGQILVDAGDGKRYRSKLS